MPFVPKKKAPYKRKVIKKPRYAKKPTVSNAVKSYVKKSLHSNIENKVYVDYGLNQSINTAATTTPVLKYLLPIMSQGTAQSQRIGNEIRIVKAVMKGHVNLLPYNATTNPMMPIYVKMWLLSQKILNTTTFATPTSFFQAGSSSIGFQGNMLDMEFPVNKDYFTVYGTRTFKLGLNETNTAAGPYTSAGALDNSTCTRPFYFDYSKHIKSKIKYDDNTTQPTNRNMFLVFQVVKFDGSSGDNSQIPCEYHYTNTVTFEDA